MAWRYFPELIPIEPQPNILRLVPNACSSDASVDLHMVITRYSHLLGSRSKFAGLLHDLFPQCGFETNLVLNAYDCGIAQRIAKVSSLDGMTISTFVLQLERNFGLQEAYAHQAIEMWAQAYDVKMDQTDETPREAMCSNNYVAEDNTQSIKKEDLLRNGLTFDIGKTMR